MTEIEQDRIQKTVDLDAPISRVWRALTDHQEFGAWFRVRLDGPFEVGAETTGRITTPGHEHVEWVSTTEKLEPERRFVFSWPPGAIDPDTDYGADAKIVVEFRLEAIAGGTRLTITESGFRQFPASKRLEALRSNAQGWDLQARNVAAHVAD